MSTSMRDAFAEALVRAAAIDPTIVVLDGDVANSTKTDRFHQALPRQFVHAGIAEQNMVGVAAGLASVGFRPFVTTFAVFATSRAHDQVRMVVAQTGLNVKIVGAYSGLLTGKTGKTHICVDDLAIFRAMPGMTVYAPADNEELSQVIAYLSRNEEPAYLRVARDEAPPVVPDGYLFDPERAVRLAEGREVTVVSTGAQTGRCLETVRVLRAEGMDVGLVHVPVLKPLPAAHLLEELRGSRLVVTVEEHNVIGGLGGAVAELLAEQDARPRLHRVGIQDVYGESGPNDALLEKYGLSAARVAERVRAAAARA